MVMKGFLRWAQLRLYLAIVIVLFLAIVIGLNFTQGCHFWWFGVRRVATAWFLLAVLALGYVLGLATALFRGRRGAG